MTPSLDSLLSAHALRLRRYTDMLDLYEGRHWLRQRSGRSSLTVNYARAIVDKGVSYLLGRGLNFSVPAAEAELSPALAARAERLLYRVYQDNDLDLVDLAAAQNAAVFGDAVWKVVWDLAERRIRVVNLDPATFFPSWSADDLGRLWRVDQAYRIPSTESERLYGLTASGRGGVAVVESWTVSHWTLKVGGRRVRGGRNPYGFIPFVHVPNLPRANTAWGVSDLRDLVGLNRALNERVSDQADTIRFHADPPVIFKGVAEHTDLTVGPGTVWDLPADADAKLLEWTGSAPQVSDHLERLQRAIYEISETPRTAFGDSGRLLSGVALETELRPLIQKTLRKRVVWTAALRRRNAMILQLAERFGLDSAQPGDFAPYRSRVIWPPMVPRDDAQDVQNNVALLGVGLRSHRTAMDALGTEDPEAELRRVVADRSQFDGPPRPGRRPSRP